MYKQEQETNETGKIMIDPKKFINSLPITEQQKMALCVVVSSTSTDIASSLIDTILSAASIKDIELNKVINDSIDDIRDELYQQLLDTDRDNEDQYMKVIPADDMNKSNLSGEIIDIFEDFLDDKGIELDNPEKSEDEDLENAAIIYGSDYTKLQDSIEELIDNWAESRPII